MKIKTLLDISDHCLVRAWFKVGTLQRTNWVKPKYKNINWIKNDEESYEVFKNAFKKLIGKDSSFNKYMRKMKRTVNSVLLRRKRIKLGSKGKKAILAAEW